MKATASSRPGSLVLPCLIFRGVSISPIKTLMCAIMLVALTQLLVFMGFFSFSGGGQALLMSELLSLEGFVAAGSGTAASAASAEQLPWCITSGTVNPATSSSGELSGIEFDEAALSTAGCRVPIVVYAWNRPQYLQRCLATLTALAYPNGNADANGDGSVDCTAATALKPRVGVFLYLDGAAPEMLDAIADATSGKWSLLPEDLRARLPRCSVDATQRKDRDRDMSADARSERADTRTALPAPLVRTIIRPVASWHPPPAQSGFFGLKQHWLWMMQHAFYSRAMPELAAAHAANAPLLFIEDDMSLSSDALPVYRAVAHLLRVPGICDSTSTSLSPLVPVAATAEGAAPAAGSSAAHPADQPGTGSAPTACWGGALSNFGFSIAADALPLSFRVMHGHSAAAYMLSRSGWEALAGCTAAAAYGDSLHLATHRDPSQAHSASADTLHTAATTFSTAARRTRSSGLGAGAGSGLGSRSGAGSGSGGIGGFVSRVFGFGDAAAAARLAAQLGSRPFHPSCTGLAHFAAFGDGWDWSFAHLQQRGGLAPSFIVPALSRVRNFGARGVTLSDDSYAASGLGTTPVSQLTAEQFVRAMTQQSSGARSSDGAGAKPTAQAGTGDRFQLIDARSPAELPANKPCRGCGVRAIANHEGSDHMCSVCSP